LQKKRGGDGIIDFNFGIGTHHGGHAPERNQEHGIGLRLFAWNVAFMNRTLPKGADLSKRSQEELDAIALQLNMRPRKRFDFKCPIEMMGQVMQEAIAMQHDAPSSIQ
jgi:hypothetical protein